MLHQTINGEKTLYAIRFILKILLNNMKKQMLFVITGDIKAIKEIFDTFKYVSL